MLIKPGCRPVYYGTGTEKVAGKQDLLTMQDAKVVKCIMAKYLIRSIFPGKGLAEDYPGSVSGMKYKNQEFFPDWLEQKGCRIQLYVWKLYALKH